MNRPCERRLNCYATKVSIFTSASREKGDAVRFIDEALTLNVETVIAGGGDGTINEVATALVERDGNLALGILPLGTANDFATSVGIPRGSGQRPEAGHRWPRCGDRCCTG